MTITLEQFNQLATKEDLKNLATKDHLDKRFDGTDKQLEDIRKEFQSADTKILDEVFAVRKDLQGLKDEMNQRFSDLHNSIDGLAKVIADYTQEMRMLVIKVDRHEKWILQIAEKLELKLKT